MAMPGNSNTITGMKNIPHGFYKGVENEISPDMFFDLVGWDGGNNKAIKTNFCVSEWDYVIAEKLLPVFNMEKYSLAKGAICIGTIGLAKKHNIRDGQIIKIMKDSKYASTKHTREKFSNVLDGVIPVRQYPLAIKKLEEVVNKYGSNKFNLMLGAEIDVKPIKTNGIQLDVPKTIKDLCDSLDYRIDRNEIFDFKSISRNNNEKCWIQTRISYPIKLLIQIFLEDIHESNKTLTACFRGAFIMGLYMILKWIKNGNLQNSDEFCLAKLIRDVELITTDNYT
ncbi:MAG: hypothetical protein MRK01_15610 [Candidatus Scalindua sp.]|nr:hypothetical protein [Candidatus Scalindua sp.]